MGKRHEDVSFNAGWIVGRLASDDDGSGFQRTVPGKHFRVRVDRIWAYMQAADGVLELSSTEQDSSEDGGGPIIFEVMGTVAEMDKLMARSRISRVKDDG